MDLATHELNASSDVLAVDWTNSIRKRGTTASVATELFMVGCGVVLLSLLAHVRIDIGVVPITGQTLGVLLVGAALGLNRGLACVGTYLLLGLCGAPVFAKLIGPAAFFGPTAGFLFSFVPAVAVVGYLADCGWDRKFSTAIWTFLIGHAIIFAIGVTWLALWLQDSSQAISLGLVPFIPGMAVKTIIATALLPFAWQLRNRQN